MMTKRRISVTLLASACFGVGFFWTVATRSQPTATATCEESAESSETPLPCCLGLNHGQARTMSETDRAFMEDLKRLRSELAEARAALATAFENEAATDEDIRICVEATIAAHNKLERRVADYIIKVRRHLTPCQQKKLFGLCAKNIRECGRRWGRGGGCGGSGGDASGACDKCGSDHNAAPGNGNACGAGKGRHRGDGE